MKRLSEKMVYRAIDAIIDVTDRLPNSNEELSMALSALREIGRNLQEGKYAK